MKRDTVVGYLYSSDTDLLHDQTVCRIIERAEPIDEGMGSYPAFRVLFNDGTGRAVLAAQLSPWYPT